MITPRKTNSYEEFYQQTRGFSTGQRTGLSGNQHAKFVASVPESRYVDETPDSLPQIATKSKYKIHNYENRKN